MFFEIHSLRIVNYPIATYDDNCSAIGLIKNATFHSRAKHIAIRHSCVREVFNNGSVTLTYYETGDMHVDTFTEALIWVEPAKFATDVDVSST